MTLLVVSPRIYTQRGVPITVTGVAQIKIISTSEEMLMIAAQQFLDKTEEDIANIAKDTLEGHQRAIIGNMTVEEIYQDRNKFNEKVFDIASSDLYNLGISMVSYTLKDIHDDEGYLKALGKPRTAWVKTAARIGEAEAQRDCGIREAAAEQMKMASQFENAALKAKAKRDYELKQYSFNAEVATKTAQSELAYQLQAAKTQQRIKEAEMEVQVVERNQRIHVEALEVTRRERELDARVKKPADAERYRLQKISEAEGKKAVKEAHAQAESIRLRGLAEAEAIEACARAEAENMSKRAQALQEYGDAARLNMVLQTIPQIAAEIAQPYSQVNKLTLVSSGADSELGASKLVDEVLAVMENLPKVIHSMTGVDIVKEMQLRS